MGEYMAAAEGDEVTKKIMIYHFLGG